MNCLRCNQKNAAMHFPRHMQHVSRTADHRSGTESLDPVKWPHGVMDLHHTAPTMSAPGMVTWWGLWFRMHLCPALVPLLVPSWLSIMGSLFFPASLQGYFCVPQEVSLMHTFLFDRDSVAGSDNLPSSVFLTVWAVCGLSSIFMNFSVWIRSFHKTLLNFYWDASKSTRIFNNNWIFILWVV